MIEVEKGQTLEGRYKVEHMLGKGGMGTVYLVEDLRLQKYWAMKEFGSQYEPDRELYLMKTLDHGAFPRVVDQLYWRGHYYLIMDYIKGNTLEEYVLREGNLLPWQAIDVGISICDGLIYLHGCQPPLVYRDIKPANIILSSSFQARMVDFGAMREYRVGREEDTICLGTPGFAAPEQFQGGGQTDPRTDLYGLGASLFFSLTSEPPWGKIKGRGPLWRVIRKCCEKLPDKRYPCANDVKEALIHCQRKYMG